jgi:DNA-binding response OmpR family regulator
MVRSYGVSKNPNPAAAESDSRLEATKTSPSAIRAEVHRRVLVVEDDIDAARSLTWILRDMGHDADYAINGYVAVDMAEKMKPEFVFLDLALPGMNGFEVCRRLKSLPALQHARIIAVSAYSQEDYRRRSKEAGCDGYIVKPLDPAILIFLLD